MEPASGNSIDIPADLLPYIFTGERVTNIEYVKKAATQHTPSSLSELYRLARVEISKSLQTWNPPLASLALESDTETSSHLHRYEALFGRDALRVAIDLLAFYPQLTRKTIIALAKLQGTSYNLAREEEPGRIPHEIRNPDDPIAKQLSQEFGWGWPYYGSVDATPEFIRTLVAYCQQTEEGFGFLSSHFTDKDGQERQIADALIDAVGWIINRMDKNPQHLLEFKTPLPGGILNQAWKDSWDSYFHSDGTIANHDKGVASIEVQRVVYDALLDAAEIYDDALGKSSEANALRQRANELKQTILDVFWTDDKGGYFVIGTDRDDNGNLRQLKIRTSNMGHLLHSRLLEGNDTALVEMRQAIIRQLFSPEMLGGNGVRTLATNEIRYRPGAYHNGSIWLWDTYFIVQGLHRHNYHLLANELSQRLEKVIHQTKMFPEFVRGDDSPRAYLNQRVVDVWDSINNKSNRIEQPPQEVQAWSVAAIITLHHYDAKNHSYSKPSQFESEIIKSIKASDDDLH